MSLRHRLLIVALAYAVVVGLGAVVVATAFAAWSRSLDERRDQLIAGVTVAQLGAAYLDQETGQRGFLISGVEAFLDPYEQGVADARRLVAELVPLLRDDPAATAALRDVEEAGDTWRTTIAEPAIRSRGTDGAQAAAAVESAESKQLFDALRGRLTALEEIVDRGVAEEGRRANRLRNAVIAVTVGLLVALVVLTAVVARLMQKWVVHPLGVITDAATRVAAGEDVDVTATGAPELVEVAAAVDVMQVTIRRQRDAAVRAREAIEQNTVLALQLRSELASDLGDYPHGWTVAAGLRAAEGVVAGDCYDVMLLGPHEIGVIVIDISGHGAMAAVSAFKCKELLKAALRSDLDPGASLEWLTTQDLGLDDRFFTAFVATIETGTGSCRYANAGHPPALLVRDGEPTTHLAPTGPLVGYGRPGWTTGDVIVEAGSVLAVYTDGLVETRDESRSFYGDDRLIGTLQRMSCEHADAVVDGVLADLTEFKPGRLADDVTLVVLCRGDVVS